MSARSGSRYACFPLCVAVAPCSNPLVGAVERLMHESWYFEQPTVGASIATNIMALYS